MALDLDVDDGPSFEELVQAGRHDILKGRTVEQCWTNLSDQHPFFKDIAEEGRRRGTALGVVLAGIEGISRAVKRAEVINAAQAAALTSPPSPARPPNGVTTNAASAVGNEVDNAEALVRVADAYLRLYSTTPVPTRTQWLDALRPATTRPATSTDTVDTNTSASTPSTAGKTTAAACPSLLPPSSSNVGRYLGKLQATLEATAQELSALSNNTAAEEDGKFAEEQLNECARCCVAAVRRVSRYTVLTKAEGKAVREMVKALQDYVGSSTLEW